MSAIAPNAALDAVDRQEHAGASDPSPVLRIGEQASSMSKKDWNHESSFLSQVESNEFYVRLLELPWTSAQQADGFHKATFDIGAARRPEELEQALNVRVVGGAL